jgi:hypothetical protein
MGGSDISGRIGAQHTYCLGRRRLRGAWVKPPSSLACGVSSKIFLLIHLGEFSLSVEQA